VGNQRMVGYVNAHRLNLTTLEVSDE
jgi:hypothetical protein